MSALVGAVALVGAPGRLPSGVGGVPGGLSAGDTVGGRVIAWLTDPANWSGPAGIPARTLEHLAVSGLSLVLAAAVALPVALWLGHLGRGGLLASGVANVGRAVPTFALLVILVLSPPPFGITNPETVTVVSLVVFAVPPILTNAYAGMRGVDPDAVDAARGMGMRGRQVLFQVELPLAVPLVVAGLRLAATQVIATATLAAFIAGPGLGRFINSGITRQDTAEFVGGAVLVAALAVTVELVFAGLQRVVTPDRTSRGEAPVPAGTGRGADDEAAPRSGSSPDRDLSEASAGM